MSLRITGGALRGRVVRLPKLDEVRPTSEKVREALFSSLQNYFDLSGITALDLFTGSGALGFEALSRGASACTFVDSSAQVCAALKDTVGSFGLHDRCRIICRNVADYLSPQDTVETKAELVFADPPYVMQIGTDFIIALSASGRLAGSGMLVLETAKRAPDLPESLIAHATRFDLVRNRTYGDTKVLLLRWRSGGDLID